MAKDVTLSTADGKTLENVASTPATVPGLSKYQALFDSNMIGVALTDFDDTIFKANDAFLSIIGYSQEDVTKGILKWSTINPQKYDNADTKKMEELFSNRTIVPFEKEYIHKKGYAVPVLVGAEASDDSFAYGVSFALDISEVKKLERKKDDFIGIVAHELRTPLSVLKLYTDLLEASLKSEVNKAELLESINELRNQTDKINVLITDLFNMAKYEAEGTTLPVSAFDLSMCVDEVVKKLSLVHERKIQLQKQDGIYVKANRDRIAQVVSNLITNALRYSGSETDAMVKVYQNDGTAYVEVQDFGIGIKSENFEKIFERYYRINHADDYAEEGAGIGLYISNEIIKSHGGCIRVQSELGKGSTFTIELPLLK